MFFFKVNSQIEILSFTLDIFPVLASLDSPVPADLFRLTCPGGPFLAVLPRLSFPRCPAVLFWQPCHGSSAPAILSCSSCPLWPVRPTYPDKICPGCLVLDVLCQLSCHSCPASGCPIPALRFNAVMFLATEYLFPDFQVFSVSFSGCMCLSMCLCVVSSSVLENCWTVPPGGPQKSMV